MLHAINPDIAEQARAALRRHVLEPLVPRCADREYGGFLVDLDERWEPAGPHNKTLEHAARTVISLALIEMEFPGEGCAELVRHGCAFLQGAIWDAVHGGFFAEVDRAGSPRLEGLKHPHAATYAVQAFVLAAPHLPAGEGRQWAERALGWLDDVAWDPLHGGYWGAYRRENERYPEGARLPTHDGCDPIGCPPGLKEINTLGDAIEALTTLVAHGATGRPVERLGILVDLVVTRLTHSSGDSSGALPYLYRRDWRPLPDLVRVGQQFQMIHRLVAAGAPLERTMERTIERARQMLDFCMNHARHPSGGYCLAVSGVGRTWPSSGASADLRQWWVQLEAAHATHVLARQPAIDAALIEAETRARYAAARDEQWTFLCHNFFDARYGGVWELPTPPSPAPRLPRWLRRRTQKSIRKTHGWKDPFHEVCTFLALMK